MINRENIKPLHKQLIKFTLIGLLAVCVDFAFYSLFLKTLPEEVLSFLRNEELAKTLSFLCGMYTTYKLNKMWTWRQTGRSYTRLGKFVALYGTSLLINVGMNYFLLKTLGELEVPYSYVIAFIGATGTSALFNFTGQRLWVFKDAAIASNT